ncbi:hypothetical protein Pmani_015770 [Petrolisthes manimaculis]|uniref:RWD domain-containing protein n=1 Tax=Petrolisthes manimaculis TaxID=1843537 RepID=A0AAE1PRI2_9EUCA|nr:hypothetical protein Pmani_015770 [Petrolisthes manimaculis]KAK4312834.1 hypothetical protein Pmani_015770 [Petrolisthes manimaculis]
MVRVNIQRTKYKQITSCFQFDSSYPKSRALIELKSRHVSDRLLQGLTKLAEGEAEKVLGKPQVLPVLRFVQTFLDDNPLCCCSEEIANVRKKLKPQTDSIKLRQKNSSVLVKVGDADYYLKYNLTIPQDYPDTCIRIEERACNYPPVFRRWFRAQSEEIARRCVQPPAKLNPQKDHPLCARPLTRTRS